MSSMARTWAKRIGRNKEIRNHGSRKRYFTYRNRRRAMKLEAAKNKAIAKNANTSLAKKFTPKRIFRKQQK